MKIFSVLLLWITIQSSGQQFPHPGAHAHNDYVHERPLFDALTNGFTSIEADVHLINGQLIVSHDHPDAKARTLQSLYLQPMDSIIRKNNGAIYKNYDGPVILMIDVKTSAEPTFSILQKTLSNYKGDLQRPGHKGAIQIVISGNRALDLIKNDPEHLATIDGRPEDIGKGYAADLMPVISEAYFKVTRENSEIPSAKALEQIKALATKVHAEKKKLRLWAIPDNETAWKSLITAGVDIINTDKLEAAHQFLSKAQ
jgi:glycerophosphoryl diester phosphodiesterase